MSAETEKTHARFIVDSDDPFLAAEQLAQGILPLLNSILSHDYGDCASRCGVAQQAWAGFLGALYHQMALDLGTSVAEEMLQALADCAKKAAGSGKRKSH